MGVKTDAATNPPASYEAELLAWRQKREQSLTGDDGWLTLVGLHWLHGGQNSVGSEEGADVPLPRGSAPERLGIIELETGVTTLTVTTDEPVTVDGVPVKTARLRNDEDPEGPSLVRISTVTFFVLQRGSAYGVRVRDLNNPARKTFAGRHWFPINPAFRVTGRFVARETPRRVQVPTSAGIETPLKNVGYVEFTLGGQALSLEAFEGSDEGLWFIFKDKTNGTVTYSGGRFMYAQLADDGTITLDFNRAYHPPCVFTPFAACPIPPKENVLNVAIEAGERD